MTLSPEQISDLIKIGIPSLVTIATAIFAWLTQIALKNKEKELFKLQFSISKQNSLFDNQLHKVDNVISNMGEYFVAYFKVLTALGQVDVGDPETIKNGKDAWESFSEVYKNRTITISTLHTLNAKSCLNVMNDSYGLYVEFFNNYIKPVNQPSHEDLENFGLRMGGIRNDFYREIGKLQVELSKRA